MPFNVFFVLGNNFLKIVKVGRDKNHESPNDVIKLTDVKKSAQVGRYMDDKPGIRPVFNLTAQPIGIYFLHRVVALLFNRKKERKFIYLSIENIIIENKNKIIHTQKGQKMS